MDKEKIKKALDHFEKDQFTDAKEVLAGEIKAKKNAFLKDKLGLKDDIEPVEKDDSEGDTGEE